MRNEQRGGQGKGNSSGAKKRVNLIRFISILVRSISQNLRRGHPVQLRPNPSTKSKNASDVSPIKLPPPLTSATRTARRSLATCATPFSMPLKLLVEKLLSQEELGRYLSGA
jgi:hypothetical protein